MFLLHELLLLTDHLGIDSLHLLLELSHVLLEGRRFGLRLAEFEVVVEVALVDLDRSCVVSLTGSHNMSPVMTTNHIGIGFKNIYFCSRSLVCLR